MALSMPAPIASPGRLMDGKKGLIMGIANDHSIAWGIARMLAGHGAKLALSYQNDVMMRRIRPLAETIGCDVLLPCDVCTAGAVPALFEALRKSWDHIDFVVCAIAHSDRDELSGRFANTSLANFQHTMLVSCYSMIEVTREAALMMSSGGSVLTLTFRGATHVVPNYNIMGVAKAALEASMRYLAADFGPEGIRVNAISAGPMRTLSGAGIHDSRVIFKYHQDHAPLQRAVTLDDIGGAALYLLSDLAAGVTGEIHYVDAGFNIINMPHPDQLKKGF